IQSRLDAGLELARQSQEVAAILLLWTTYEAILRKLSERLNLPTSRLPTSSLIRSLYSQGAISHGAYELGLRVLDHRNRLTHGYRVEIDKGLMESFGEME